MTIFNKNNIFIFNVLFLIILFAFPNGGNNKFNGVPWSNSYETLVIIIYFPLIFFLFKSFFKTKYAFFLIIIALILKFFLNFYPSVGIGHNIYLDDENIKLKTYTNFWQDKYSIIQEYEWNEKDNFPIGDINFRKKYNDKLGSNAKSNENYDKLVLRSEIDFYINYNEINNLVILFDGDSNNSKIEFRSVNSDKYQNLQYDLENKQYFIAKNKKYDGNVFHFKGNLYFNDVNWKFSPHIVKGNKKFSAFDENIIFTDNIENDFLSKISKFKIFSLYELIIFFIVSSSLFYLIYNICKKNFINNEITYSIVFLIITISIDFVLLKIGFYHQFWPLCITLIIFIFILIINNFFDFNLFKNILKDPNNSLIIIIYPTFAYIGFLYFNLDFLKTSYWAYGNDWLNFAYYSKKIVLENEWIEAGEKTFYFRPGIRYFYAILHIFFGDSAFALKLIEYLLIFFISIISLNIMLKTGTSIYFAIIFSLILLIFYIGESFRWLIGRGLSEFYGTFIIMLMCYLFMDNKINYFKIFILGILGIISCWLREEKLLLVLPLILFTQSEKILHKNFFIFILNFLKNNFKKVILFWTIVILGFPILFEFRNYYLSGNFSIINHPSLYLVESSIKFHINPFYEIVLGTPYGNIPRLIPLFTIPTFVIALLIIFVPKLYRRFPFPGLSVAILSIILPTLFLHLTAYIPRHSIYLLPFSIILFTKIFENSIKSFVDKNFT